jgi:TolB-like protein
MTRVLPVILIFALWQSPSLAASKYEESLKELAEGVAAEAIKMKKERLAVLDFVDQKGTVTPIGQFLAEEVATQLLVVGDLKVVDHKLLLATMKKHRLTHLEAAQAKAAKKVAKSLRADLFVTGTYLDIPEGIQITAKLVGPYTVQPVGAARGILPKSGPLAALLKQQESPTKEVKSVPKPAAPAIPVSKLHQNELYRVVLTSISRQPDHIAVELLFENRSGRDLRIACRLQDTYIQDAEGAQWKQDVSHSRESLCTRGLELAAARTQRVTLSFPVKDKAPGGTLSLHMHETAPRPDAVVAFTGIDLEPVPAVNPPEPAPVEPPPASPPDAGAPTS